MKTINITFENKEFEQLIKIKKETNWHDFIMQLIKKEVKQNETNNR